jgi:hypothetical protein
VRGIPIATMTIVIGGCRKTFRRIIIDVLCPVIVGGPARVGR